MATLSSFLPKPKHATASAPAAAPASTATLASTALAARTGVALASAKPSTGAAPSASAHSTALVTSGPPPYRHRAGWVPRTLLDFADGGAFPEIHLAQYPLDLGRKDRDATRLAGKTLALRVDESGEIVYDALAKHGHARSQHVHATIADLVPMDRSADDDAVFARPDEEEVERTAERTRAALSKIVGGKLDASKVSSLAVAQPGKPQYIRYTPDAVGGSAASSGQTKVIRIVEAQIDPIEPPRFAHKKVPKGPDSPPAPVMHSPPRKVSKEEQREWRVPPCISNWKNARGYTIPLDKRLAADGRGLQEVTINDNFAKFAEALYIADRHAREEVEKRAQMQKKLAQKEKEAKEMHLRMLAQKAREERSGIVGAGMSVGATAEEIADARGVAAAATEEPYAPPRTRDEGRGVADDKDEDYNERERLRREAQRDVQRKIRMTHMGADARARMAGGDRERDVSEKIALGGAAPTGGKEAQYDQRLFSQSTGLSAGFRDEDAYDLYDKPLFQGTSTSVYRPTRGAGVDGPDAEASADAEIAKLSSTSRFVPDRGFQGADAAGPRDGPVQFEKADDPFGIDKFLEDATRGGDGTKGKRGVGEEEGRGGDQDKRRRHD